MITNVLLVALLVSPLSQANPSSAQPVATAEAACSVVKATVISLDHLPANVIAFCDPMPETDVPRGYYVMALHSNRQCDGICSTNMGWFAVQRSTGAVFDWDVADWKLGDRVAGQP